MAFPDHTHLFFNVEMDTNKSSDFGPPVFPLSYIRGNFYVRRIGLHLYKYRIYGTINLHLLKGVASVYQLI